jgi:hypothetical protein
MSRSRRLLAHKDAEQAQITRERGGPSVSARHSVVGHEIINICVVSEQQGIEGREGGPRHGPLARLLKIQVDVLGAEAESELERLAAASCAMPQLEGPAQRAGARRRELLVIACAG